MTALRCLVLYSLVLNFPKSNTKGEVILFVCLDRDERYVTALQAPRDNLYRAAYNASILIDGDFSFVLLKGKTPIHFPNVNNRSLLYMQDPCSLTKLAY